MGSFGEKRKKLFFRFCRPILDIFGFPLLSFKKLPTYKYREFIMKMTSFWQKLLDHVIILGALAHLSFAYIFSTGR